ncbi:unnamed protein product [Rotaria sp. Silwood2]|nr:unnamed protein product [Rotaria sp. Silwood2]CAF4312142.1 unnamed protein product [Rotaria sp. Silwood2]
MHESVSKLHRTVFHRIQTFNEPDACVELLSEIQHQQVFFIVSNSLGQIIVPIIHDLSQVHVIYVFNEINTDLEQTWTNNLRKIEGSFMEISTLCDSIKQKTQEFEQNLTSISIIPETSSTHLNELDPSFMYSQLLKEMILEMDHDEQSKAQFVQYCHDAYADNTTLLRLIDDFDHNYYSHSPIWWYTKEPFIYSVLNRALRTQNIEIVLKMSFFVQALHRQIEKLYSETREMVTSIVYRGQGMTNSEFEKIKNNQGGLLAFNNFLSTSRDEHISLTFAESSSNDPDLTGVFFHIDIDASVTSTPFVSLDNISYYTDSEREILFSMHTIFRIGEIQQIHDQLWQVKLTLTNQDDEQLKLLTNYVRYETQGPIGHYRLGTLMIKMGEFDKAELFFQSLIEKTPVENWELLAHIYNQLGYVHQSKGNPKAALADFHRTLEIRQKFLPLTHPDLAKTYNNIAMVYDGMGNYSTALENYQNALKIQQQSLPSIHVDLATTYNNIGLVHRSMENPSVALQYFEKVLEIQKQMLPPTHPDLASTFCNIGTVHHFIGAYSTALTYFIKTLEIQQKALPTNHPNLAIAYNNVGMVYDEIGDSMRALSYYQKGLDITKNILPFNHPYLATRYNNVATIYYSMKDYQTAIAYFEKTVGIQEKILQSNHPALATTYNNLGDVHDAMKNHSTALVYYQKALKIEQKSLSSMHPSLAITLNNIGMVYEATKDFSIALSYYEEALKIQQKSLPPNHPQLADVYNNIGTLKHSMNEHPTALYYYQKALEIQRKILPSNHPDLASLYTNIGVTHRSMGEQLSAFDYFEKALKILQVTLPIDYSLMATTHFTMAQTYEDLSQYKEAVEHALRALNVIDYVREPNPSRKQKYQDFLEKLREKF